MVVFAYHFNNVDHNRRVFINGDRIFKILFYNYVINGGSFT